jgi:hypothetical protein
MYENSTLGSTMFETLIGGGTSQALKWVLYWNVLDSIPGSRTDTEVTTGQTIGLPAAAKSAVAMMNPALTAE